MNEAINSNINFLSLSIAFGFSRMRSFAQRQNYLTIVIPDKAPLSQRVVVSKRHQCWIWIDLGSMDATHLRVSLYIICHIIMVDTLELGKLIDFSILSNIMIPFPLSAVWDKGCKVKVIEGSARQKKVQKHIILYC